ncbi:hypothetical protein CASFOL_042303 [Castilleja foliolosa]|uniref:Uncharacterized protein n=1 Tax=Castilleja foliolosa TaxID=1961234 RepID=A0ABD3BAD5_9LAMI
MAGRACPFSDGGSFWTASYANGGGGEVQIVVVVVFRGVAGGFRRGDASFFLSLEFRIF